MINDTREKLEADVRDYYRIGLPGIQETELNRLYCKQVLEWLDRQAAITELELNALLEEHGVHINHDGLRHFTTVEFERGGCTECANDMGIYADSLCDPLKREVAELQAKMDELTDNCDHPCYTCSRLAELLNEVGMLRAKVKELENDEQHS